MATELTSDEKMMAALGYWGSLVLGFIPALVIFLIKKDESKFVKKHSLQSLVLAAACVVIGVVTTIISIIVGTITLGIGSLLIGLLQMVFFLGILAYYIVLGVQVYQGQDPEIPMLTDMVRGQLS